MAEKKTPAVSPATESAADPKTRKTAAKADYRATHKVGVQSCKVYVKPEEGTAYYVINKVSGKLDL